MTEDMTENAPQVKPAKPAVLIVDDELSLLDVISESLADEFEIVTTSSATEAEQVMSGRAFDVVVCDHLMPGGAGLDFLVCAMERWPATRRIMFTGYMNPELISRSVTIAELSACLIKPVRSAELARVIRETLKKQ